MEWTRESLAKMSLTDLVKELTKQSEEEQRAHADCDHAKHYALAVDGVVTPERCAEYHELGDPDRDLRMLMFPFSVK